MRKVCEVYLVSSASSDERGVELTFPVSQYEMMDAFEQIHTKSPGDVYWQVDEFYCFDYLAPHLDESMSIFEFNSLTEQLSKLDNEVRMRKAAEILTSEPNALIKEVAASVGFENQYFFSTKFKEYYGVSPNNYKDQ